jgi:hypothetical protein
MYSRFVNRLPPRLPGIPKAQIAEEKRAEETQAELDKKAEAEHETKHETHHTKKAHHAHHAAQSKPKPNAPRPHGHHDPHEAAHAAHMAEAMGWAPDSSAEAAEKKADADEAHEEEQREKAASDGQKRIGATTYAATAANKAEAGHDNKKDAFQKSNQAQAKKPELNSKSAELPNAVTASKTIDAARAAAERMMKAGKPLDAFALLQLAEQPGVLFKENGGSEAEVGQPEDPELAAAVEEMISKLFGVKGILRVGAGRNKDDEPVVVVAVGQGFGEASLRAVPEKVGKFPALIALPFDILPLKKER